MYLGEREGAHDSEFCLQLHALGALDAMAATRVVTGALPESRAVKKTSCLGDRSR